MTAPAGTAAQPAPDRDTPETRPAQRRRRLGRFEWALLAIALAGLVFRVGYVVVTRGDDTLCGQRLCGDAIYYSAQADRLGEGRGFQMLIDLEWVEAADHPPLTALVMAPVSFITGDRDPITYQRLTMALIGFFVILAVGLLGRRVGGRRGETVGLLAAGIAAVNANFWMNDVIVMSETLATLAVVLALWAVYRFIDAPTWRWAAAVGALIGVAALARAELAMLGLVTFAPVALWARSLAVPARLGRIAVAGACALAVLAPWTAYNLSRFNEPVLMSTNDGLTILGANCADVYGLDGQSGGVGFWSLGCALRMQDQIPAGADQSEVSRIYRDAGVDFIGAHKHRVRNVAEFRLLKGWGFYAPEQMVWLNKGEGRTPWASWTGFVQWWLLLAAAIAGGVILRRRGRPVWPLASMFVVVTITMLGFYGIVRFRIAADVAATVLAAVALEALIQWWRNRSVGEPAETVDMSETAQTAASTGGHHPHSALEAAEELVLRPPTAEEVVPARHGPTHFPCLDAYRGIGMTMVLLNHAAYSTGFLNRDGRVAQFLTPFIARLDLSVPMFFVMSGFLLYRPFAKATLTDGELPALGTFYRRRVLRILPAYWVALALIGIVFGLHIAGVTGWVGNALLLPAVGVPVEACTDGGTCRVSYGLTQAWSIGVEATFYLALPLFAALVHRVARRVDANRRWAVVVAALALLYALGTGFRGLVVAANPSWAEQSLLWLPMFTDLFAIGMGLAALSAAVSIGRPLPRLFAWLGDHPVAAWSAAGVVFLAVTRMKYPAQPFGLRDVDGSSDYLPRQFLYGIASALWLAPAIFGDQSKGLLRRLLRSRPLVYLGAISLSFYLWHLVIIDRAKAWTVPDYLAREAQAANPRPGNALDGLATFTGSYGKVVIITWLVSVIVASVSYRFVELPFLRLKDRPLADLWPGRDGNRTVALDDGSTDTKPDERSGERVDA